MTELKKDKYLLLLLCGLLLIAYVKTHDSTIGTLLVTCVGGFLSLVRATPAAAPTVSTDSGNVSVSQEVSK